MKPNETLFITVTIRSKAKTDNVVQLTFQVTVLPSGQVTAGRLTPAPPGPGQFKVTISGTTGAKYILETSTNLKDWVAAQTNIAPFVFTDMHAGEFSRRFYRSVSVQ